ncbi:MAG TPA: DnaJ domain-containing protein [Roseiflexaceae bacterium]|nr:DnaJ domain-containing protein [Roseiflexaceae bacterium]
MPTQDHYEILQVHPKADAAAIEAAYRRLCDQYDPQRLDGAAEELVAIARHRREALEQAYAVLIDPARRAAYDAATDQRPTTNDQQSAVDAGSADERSAFGVRRSSYGEATPGPQRSALNSQLSGGDTTLDYRPLPPARREERPRGFNDQPTLAGARPTSAPPGLAALIVVAAVVVPALVLSLALTSSAPAPPLAAATPTASPVDQFEPLIAQARAFAEQNPQDARAWVDLGNLLYDSAQIVREQAPDSALYRERLPRWLDAIEAYSRALALEPDNAGVLADRGASACFYGAAAPEERYLVQGLADTTRALEIAPDNPRALLSHGYCLVSARPPRTAEAVAAWQRIPALVPADSPLVSQARLLVQQYGQR